MLELVADVAVVVGDATMAEFEVGIADMHLLMGGFNMADVC